MLRRPSELAAVTGKCVDFPSFRLELQESGCRCWGRLLLVKRCTDSDRPRIGIACAATLSWVLAIKDGSSDLTIGQSPGSGTAAPEGDV